MFDLTSLKTLRDVYRFAVSKANDASLFYGHGTDNVFDDMLSLVMGSLKLPFEKYDEFLDCRLTQDEKRLLANQLQKRIVENVPVPYLIHEAYFCGLSFFVDERVLIPRSPIGELILNEFSPWLPSEPRRILDLCTGSGCIALALKMAFDDALVDAVDLSDVALGVAHINHERLGCDDTIQFYQGDLWDALPKGTLQYDLIVSNPPYVSAEENASLPKEYTHEPFMALVADDNGLRIVKRILENASQYLTDNGILVVEVGNSEEALIEAYPHVPFMWLTFEKGGQGIFLLTKSDLLNYF